MTTTSERGIAGAFRAPRGIVASLVRRMGRDGRMGHDERMGSVT